MSLLRAIVWLFLFTFLSLKATLNERKESPVCLAPLREIAWDYDTTHDLFKGSMTLKMAKITSPPNLPISYEFETRLFNGKIPPPLLRMKRGKTYNLTLHNELIRTENPSDCDITNLHTHGLHISGNKPGDSILTKIYPGESFTYQYYLPRDHSGGTHWYHPHWHRGVDVQVGGGAAGVIIVEDDPVAEGFEPWLTNMHMNEVIIQIFHATFGALRPKPSRDCHYSHNGEADFYLVNGEYQPYICIEKGEWTRLRISHVDHASVMTLLIDSSDCLVELLAKDGILLNRVPRTVPRNARRQYELYFTQAGRVDVAIMCRNLVDVPLMKKDGNIIIANIHVKGDERTVALTPFRPRRPFYLRPLHNERVDYNWQVTVGFNSINGKVFNESGDIYIRKDVIVHSVEEWSLMPEFGIMHPLHLHVNPFEIQTNCERSNEILNLNDLPFDIPLDLIDSLIENTENRLANPIPNGWYQKGDWADTFECQTKIRFRVDRFDGDIYMHCHILHHEDIGSMAMLRAHLRTSPQTTVKPTKSKIRSRKKKHHRNPHHHHHKKHKKSKHGKKKKTKHCKNC